MPLFADGTMKSFRCSSREGSCGSGFANTNVQDHGFSEGSNATVEIGPARVVSQNASSSERFTWARGLAERNMT